MPTFRTEITVRTRELAEIVDITDRIEDACARSGIRNGIALIFPHHTSSAVYISDCDRGLTSDFGSILSELVPDNRQYEHDITDCKKNAAGHIRATLSGHHAAIPVTDGRPDLGRFQAVYYAEFDGRREKGVVIKIVGE